MSFREVWPPPGARGMTFEKCYDKAREKQLEEVSREMPRVMTDATSVSLNQHIRAYESECFKGFVRMIQVNVRISKIQLES